MSDRTYSEREVAAIIQRAAEAQHREAPDDVPGLTLSEIERVGREAGIDPARLRQAASELDAGLLSGGAERPGTAVAEAWVEGAVRPEAWEDAVTALRLRAGAPAAGTADTSAVGEAREWTHVTALGTRTTVSVSPRGNRTRVRVMTQDAVVNARLQATVVGSVVALVPAFLLGALVAEGLGFGDFAGVAALLTVFVVTAAALSETLTRKTHARRDRQATEADRLAADLARRLGAPAAAPVGETGEPAATRSDARIDPSLLDAEPESPAERSPEAARRTRS